MAFVLYVAALAVQINFFGINTAANVVTFLATCISINIGLGIFNLIPVPPLDGSRIFLVFLPDDTYFRIMQYERYIQLALVALLFLGFLDMPLNFLFSKVWGFIETLAISLVSLFL